MQLSTKIQSVTLPDTTINKRKWSNLTSNSGLDPMCMHMPLVTYDCSSEGNRGQLNTGVDSGIMTYKAQRLASPKKQNFMQ